MRPRRTCSSSFRARKHLKIVDKGRFRQVSDTTELETLIDRILAEHPSDAEDFRKGNAKVMGFVMGLA